MSDLPVDTEGGSAATRAAVHPLSRLYGLARIGGAELEDGATFLRLRGLALAELGEEASVELIGFVLDSEIRPLLERCRLAASGAPAVDLLATERGDWLGLASLAELYRAGKIDRDTFEFFSDLAERLELRRIRGPRALGKEALRIVRELAAREAPFELELSVRKKETLDRHLLPLLALPAERVSAAVWRSPEMMAEAFEGFGGFLDFLAGAAERPMVLFFLEATPSWAGNYLHVASLADLASARGSVPTDLSFPAYAALRRQLVSEERTGEGERRNLPPDLFLRRNGEIAGYPNAPLHTEGPFRSALLYALLAWLAQKTEERTPEEGGDIVTFTVPSRGGVTEVEVELTLDDARLGGESVFDAAGAWRRTLPLLAYDVHRATGRRSHRKLWSRALSELDLAQRTGSELLPALEEARERFNRLEATWSMVDKETERKASPLLEIRVFLERDSRGSRLAFELHSDSSLGYFRKEMGSVPIVESDPEVRYHEMDRLASHHLARVLGPRGAELRKLETRGRALWDKLIPEVLKHEYADLRQRELTMLVVSKDPSFPWELVKPFEKGKDSYDDPWWALKFRLSRWLVGTRYPARQLRLRRICCVASSEDTMSAEQEAQGLEELARRHGVELDRPRTSGEILETLSARDYGLIHFSAHGAFDRRQPGESAIRLPDRTLLQPDDLFIPEIMERFAHNRPLVFLNSCHSAETGASMTGLGGWAERLLEMECGAFVGAGWDIADPLGADFALALYRRLIDDGVPLGEAVREARLHLQNREPANSTWLAYYLFGDPLARMRTDDE